jgi:hypothetical protein
MAGASKSLVRRPPPPPPNVDYRFDLSRKTVAGFATAGIAIAFLIFLSGLVLGVSIERPVAEPAAPAETTEPVARRGAVRPPAAAPAEPAPAPELLEPDSAPAGAPASVADERRL